VAALTKKIAVEFAVDPAPGAPAEAATDEIRALVAREYPAVWRFLRRLGVPSSQVDDAAQRVFARVLAQRQRITRGSERAYLMRAAFRSALEQQRANKRQLARASDVDGDQLASPAPAPDQSLAQQEELRLLDRALAQLSPELRAVFTLAELEELSFSEIAVALQLPRGTVASRMRRAKEQFTQAVRRLQAGGGK
jgi:RNA polymerase sigma-70 factor, ECF subfamily